MGEEGFDVDKFSEAFKILGTLGMEMNNKELTQAMVELCPALVKFELKLNEVIAKVNVLEESMHNHKNVEKWAMGEKKDGNSN